MWTGPNRTWNKSYQDSRRTLVGMSWRELSLPSYSLLEVISAIALHSQPTSDKGTNALIVFSAAESLGSHCKSQSDILLSNYTCYEDG